MVMALKADKPRRRLDENRKAGFFSNNKYILLSFLVPFVLMSVAFAVANVAPFGILKTLVESIGFHLNKIFPFLGIEAVPNMDKPWGTNQMLVVDLWHQYYPFLVDLQEKLQSGGSLFWTWSVGLGTNFIAMMSYYLLSPLNFLSVFFSSDALVGYLAVITVIKISLAGLFTAICFKIIFKKHDLSLVFFSVMYSFCSFCMGYYWCTIWLDSWAMLPLVVAGTVCLLRDGKYKLFIISLALAVVFNYYIGLFICVAVFLTAIGYTAACWKNLRKSLKDLLRTVICSVTALLMTAPITVPAYLALQNCYKSTNRMPTKFDINIGTDDFEGTIDALGQIFGNFISFLNPTTKEGLPNVACGLLCLVLLGVFFCAKKIKLGEKIFCCVTLLFLVASFIFRHLDYMWHGFHYPNMLPYRFSFLVSFLLIYMAYRAFLLLKDSSYFDVIIGALVFSLFILLHFLRTEEDGFNKAAAVASIIIGGVMIILLLMYTLRILPKRVLSILLCLIVCGEMCATAIIGVNSVSTTTMSGYPRESLNVERIIDQIDQISEDEEPDLFRTEVTSTQTLNDGALNGYNGISVFNSMANVSITKYAEFLGCSGWKAGNRYTYSESSPVTNTIFNLRYLISRNGSCYTGDYMELVSRSNNVSLYENTQYVNMGFLTDSELENFTVSDTTYNPFENQIEFWRLATGIEEPLYTQLEVKDVGHSSDNLSYTKTSEGVYSFSPKDTTSSKHLKFNYYLEEDAMVYAYFYVSNAEDKGNIYINDSSRNSINVKQPFISAIGNKSAGDKISLYCKIKSSGTTSVRVYCYALNQDVYEAGIEKFREGAMDISSVSDTSIEGTVTAQTEGLLYTSIPYEKGWTVTVDGKEAEMVTVGNAMCAVKVTAGTHTIRFSYVPNGFVIGVLAFAVAVLIFAFFCVCTSKKFRNKAFAKPVVWIFDPQVPDRIKETDIVETSSDEPDLSEEDQQVSEPSQEDTLTDNTPDTDN